MMIFIEIYKSTFARIYFTVMSPRTCEQTPVTMSPTTNTVAQSHFNARDLEVSITILLCEARRRSLGRAILVPPRQSVAFMIAIYPVHGKETLASCSPRVWSWSERLAIWRFSDKSSCLYCFWLHNNVIKIAQSFNIICRGLQIDRHGIPSIQLLAISQ